MGGIKECEMAKKSRKNFGAIVETVWWAILAAWCAVVLVMCFESISY